MPLDFERITLNAIPDGDLPVFHASQFETMRPFIADLKWGTEDFAPGEGNWCTLSIRKTDDTLVIIDDIDIDNNTVSCILTQQSVACFGDNFCQLKVWGTEDDEDGCIACLNFILHVQPDPEAGGLTSESEINNLTEQIETIAQEVIGEDYYNKTEVDGLISGVESQIPTKTSDLTNDSGYITTADLTPYAKTADLATVATTGDYDDLLNKPTIPDAQIQSDWEQADNTKVDYIKNKPDIDAMIADALLAVMPVGTETGPIASFDTEIDAPFVNVSCNVNATGGNGTPDNSNPIVGYSSANITRCGVNIWDEEWEQGGIDGTTGLNNNESNCIRSKNYIKVTPGATYYCKAPTTWSYHQFRGRFYNSDKSYNQSMTFYDNATFTVPLGCGYMRFVTPANEVVTTYGNDISINYPATDTTYHAYNGSTVTIAFGQTVYGSVLDVTRGKLHVTHGKYTLDNTATAGQFDINTYTDRNRISYVPYQSDGKLDGTFKADKLETAPNSPGGIGTGDFQIFGSPTAPRMWITVPTTIATVADFLTYISSNPIDVVYELATPFDIDLTPIQIRALVGNNNVYSDTNGDTAVQYKDSIQHYIDSRV